MQKPGKERKLFLYRYQRVGEEWRPAEILGETETMKGAKGREDGKIKERDIELKCFGRDDEEETQNKGAYRKKKGKKKRMNRDDSRNNTCFFFLIKES